MLEQNYTLLKNEQNRLNRGVKNGIDKHKNILNQFRINFGYIAKNNLHHQATKLNETKINLDQKILNLFERSKNEIRIIENKVDMLDPMQVLKRGFSLTTFEGQTIKEDRFPKKGDFIQTITAFGKIDSKVQEN